MSFRRFNLFSSNASIDARRSSTRSSRPPTYNTAAPSYTTSANDRRASGWSVDTDSIFDQTEFAPTGTVSIKRTSVDITRPAGPHYSELGCYFHHKSLDDKLFSVYYRVYTEDGAIPSTNQVYSDDPHLGRILAELVAPPHIAISLKHCLLSVENIDVNTPSNLFISASSHTPMDDAGRVSILAYPGPGCTPNEPMALVVKLSDSGRSPLDEKKPEAVLLPSPEGPTPFEMRYSTRY